MTLSAYIKRLSLVVLTAALAPASFASWTVGYDEEAAKCYLEDTSVGWKLWIKTNTKTKAPDYVSVGDVKGYEINRLGDTDSCTAVAAMPTDGVLDLTDVATGTEGGYPVVALGRTAFAGTAITSFKGPECRSFGVYAFQSCSSLTDVEISPNATTLFSWGTWDGCTALVRFTPTCFSKVTSVDGHGGFGGLTALEGDWSFPGMVNQPGGAVFNGCSSITSIRMDNVTALPGSFCLGCSSLTNAVLPKVVTLNGQTFQNCKALKTVTLGESMTSFGNNCFLSCEGLETLEPNVYSNVISLSQYAFQDCHSLRGSLSFPNATTVGECTFRAAALDEVYLPKLETTPKSCVFQNTPHLAKVTVGGVGTIGKMYTFYNANSAGDKITHLYWIGTNVPAALETAWLGNAQRARIYCRGAALRAWIAQLKTLVACPGNSLREKADFSTYGDDTKTDYPGDIARAIFVNYSSCNFWLCDWDYEGDTYNTTIECPEDVGVGDVFVNGELILPRNNVYKIPQDCTLTITYEALNGKLFEDGTGTYVKKGIAAAETIPASTCDKNLKEAAKRQLTLSLTDLAAKNIAEVALVCAKDFTCSTNDNVITWEVMDSVAFDLVYTCAGAYRFTDRAKTLTQTYSNGITEDAAVNLDDVETPKEYEPVWEIVYDKDAKQAYLVNDILGWKLYLRTDSNKGTWTYTRNGVTGYDIYRNNDLSAVAMAPDDWELDLTNVKRDTTLPVVGVGYGAFKKTTIKRFIAPDCRGVDHITFEDCPQLTEVEVSPDISDLFNYQRTFNKCPLLTTFRPTVLTNIVTVYQGGFGGANGTGGAPVGGDWVFPNLRSSTGAIFNGCKNPNGFTVSMPNCTNLPAHVFRSSTVTRVELPVLRNLPESMVENCSLLGEVLLTNTIHSIGGKAFSGCTSLTNLSLNVFPTVVNMGWYAFDSCKSLRGTLEFPVATNFGDHAFALCTNLTSVVGPKAQVWQYAFYGCTALKTATIGGYGPKASSIFSNDKALTDIYVTDAWPVPETKATAMFSWGGDGNAETCPPIVHVRVADDTDYSAWEKLCSYKKADLPASCKKIANYGEVRKLLGYVGNAPYTDAAGNITVIYNSSGNIAWLARWPHDWGFTIILR